MTTKASIDQFLSQKTLALAGASRKGKKIGNAILKELTKKDYEVTPIHPEVSEIDGRACCSSIADLPHPVGGLVVAVAPGNAAGLVREAIDAGIRNIWIQQDSKSPETEELSRSSGINVVHGECILMFAQPTGIHWFHRWLRSVFGKLPKD